MSAGRHTPGPWRVGKFCPDAEFRALTEHLAIGRAIPGEPLVALCGQVGDPESSADAALIAAAPDLLEALEAMVGKAGKQNWNDHYPDELAAAYAAIAKARPE